MGTAGKFPSWCCPQGDEGVHGSHGLFYRPRAAPHIVTGVSAMTVGAARSADQIQPSSQARWAAA